MNAFQVRDTADNPISEIDFADSDATKTIRLFNAGDGAPATLELGAMTAGLAYAGDRNAQGQAAITGQWLEARVGADPWTPIGGDLLNPANVLALTPPVPGDHIDVELRLVGSTGIFSVVPVVLFPVG